MKYLVFGGSGLLGSAIARELHKSGHDVVITYFRNHELAADLKKKQIALDTFECNIEDRSSIEFTFEKAQDVLGTIDNVIIAAGAYTSEIFEVPHVRGESLRRMRPSKLERMMRMYVTSPMMIIQVSMEYLKSAPSNIVLLGSLDGMKAIPSPVHYATAKSGLKGLVEAVAKDIGARNILINQISLPPVEGGAQKYLSEDQQKRFKKHCAMERFPKPEEVATFINMFVEHNTYVTGQSIVLDGGL